MATGSGTNLGASGFGNFSFLGIGTITGLLSCNSINANELRRVEQAVESIDVPLPSTSSFLNIGGVPSCREPVSWVRFVSWVVPRREEFSFIGGVGGGKLRLLLELLLLCKESRLRCSAAMASKFSSRLISACRLSCSKSWMMRRCAASSSASEVRLFRSWTELVVGDMGRILFFLGNMGLLGSFSMSHSKELSLLAALFGGCFWSSFLRGMGDAGIFSISQSEELSTLLDLAGVIIFGISTRLLPEEFSLLRELF